MDDSSLVASFYKHEPVGGNAAIKIQGVEL